LLDGDEYCMRLEVSSQKWRDMTCTSTYSYACSSEANVSTGSGSNSGTEATPAPALDTTVIVILVAVVVVFLLVLVLVYCVYKNRPRPMNKSRKSAARVAPDNSDKQQKDKQQKDKQRGGPPSSLTFPGLTPASSGGKDALHAVLLCGEYANFLPTTNLKHASFSVDPSLPLGMSISRETGAISGSPETVVERKTYTVAAVSDGERLEAKVVMATSGMYDEDAVFAWTPDQVQMWLERELGLPDNVRVLFAGFGGESLAKLDSSEAGFWKDRGATVDKPARNLVVRGVLDLVQRSQAAKDRKVLSSEQEDIIRQTAGAGRSVDASVLGKFDEVCTLKTGRPAEAASGLEALMCVDHGKPKEAFYDLVQKGVKGIEEEVAELVAKSRNDSSKSEKYVQDAIEVGELLDYILNHEVSEKVYDNGIRDQGRPSGTRLKDFTSHKKAVLAGLKEEEVVAMRLYTTVAYSFMNNPLRDSERSARGEPCLLPVATYFAEQGIKKLRKLNAPDSVRQLSGGDVIDSGEHGNGGKGVTLWRGMRSVTLTDAFRVDGGTELAFMSTTGSLEVAVRYSLSGSSLLFKIKASGFMVIGAEMQWLSAFPAEQEVLYPPLTYLKPTGRTESLKVHRDGKELQFEVIEVEPMMG